LNADINSLKIICQAINPAGKKKPAFSDGPFGVKVV
jgi:hypothetical protein